MYTERSNEDELAKRLFFAKELRSRRLSKGWSQEHLASKIGTDSKTVSRWERSKNIA